MIRIRCTEEGFLHLIDASELSEATSDSLRNTVLDLVSRMISTINESIDASLRSVNASKITKLFTTGQIYSVGLLYDYLVNLDSEIREFGDKQLKTKVDAVAITLAEILGETGVELSASTLLTMAGASAGSAAALGFATAMLVGFLYNDSEYQKTVNNSIKGGLALTHEHFPRLKLSADATYIKKNVFKQQYYSVDIYDQRSLNQIETTYRELYSNLGPDPFKNPFAGLTPPLNNNIHDHHNLSFWGSSLNQGSSASSLSSNPFDMSFPTFSTHNSYGTSSMVRGAGVRKPLEPDPASIRNCPTIDIRSAGSSTQYVSPNHGKLCVCEINKDGSFLASSCSPIVSNPKTGQSLSQGGKK